MKSFISLLLVAISIAGTTQASSSDDHSLLKRHHDLHARLSNADILADTVAKRDTKQKRCKKPSSSSGSVDVAKPSGGDSKNDTKPATAPTNTKGLIQVTDSKCGPSKAVAKSTATSGPMGSIDWLNCGVAGSGWTPPDVQIKNIVSTDLVDALKDPKSPFKACSKYISAFNSAASKHGLPAIMIASIALQESSCDPSTVGGGGEQGLMQITKDKCKAAPGGNCKDPNYNIDTGAAYLASQIKDNSGNVLLAVGSYNGWVDKLTIAKATKAKHSSCCRCQNNLDYLHQFFNGWMQNIDAYSANPPLGKYFNLDDC